MEEKRLAVPPSAAEALERMLQAINGGLATGRVTRSQLAAWIIIHFEKTRFEKCVELIRRDHFDHLAHLESLIADWKKARRAGETTPKLEEVLKSLTPRSRKTRSKSELG